MGFNRIYDRNLARGLARIYRSHAHLFEGVVDEPPYQLGLAASCSTIREFDDALTRVTFGWPSVDAYYAGAPSSIVAGHMGVALRHRVRLCC